MERVLKSTEKKRHYCSVCSNFRGKIVDGTPIILHKFPANDYLKKTWVRRIKTVMVSFVLTKNSRLCSAHFEGGKMSNENNVPSIFDLKTRRKLFGTSKVTPVEFVPTVEPEDDGPLYATRLEDYIAETLYQENDENQPMEIEECEEDETCDNGQRESLRFYTNASREMTSISLHDYCGVQNSEFPTKLNKTVQTEKGSYGDTLIVNPKQTKDQSTQTFVPTRSILTQTESESEVMVKSCSVSTQVTLPDITFEDISSDDEEVSFYTGLPNAGTFYSLFDMLDDASIQTERKGIASGKSGRQRHVRLIDEFFIILMRLRLGLLIEDLCVLSYRIGVV